MRLTDQQVQQICQIVAALVGSEAEVWLFGSRVDDRLKGGDVDLLIRLSHPVENPALVSARLSAKISRAMAGRKVDILLWAPNLQRQPVHDWAQQTGVRLQC
ncbi:nucleotidyltransferase domain-containing protein [Thermosynechococcus sp. PP45]|uniref:nucleotidyltransferase domain-containing protein n=1 Tax=unclassified Thermosynechococcus TaxID=2622553 RepID=UPI002672CFDC|nr:MULTISPECIES: nucleotidyltransferase domain-containing protein [unclassified Thermosynechococcus]WKT81007.1 nucleotidyltransferase domain-containing protein [Thermosynechococcus sp. PP45]WNC24618.1 nucleotidyltransferase domain-containing protein [Thermosynechococcus sp. PP551]WNC27196.1 nucleotidyltransferase domain-containing protein [Thermosynechococcus sp. PP555]